MLFDLANLAYWILFSLGIILFLLAIFSGGGDEKFNLGEGDADLDVNGEFSFASLLGWMGVGKAPLLLLLATDFSLWGIFGWMLNVFVGRVTGTIPQRFLGLGGVIFLLSFSVSLVVGSFLSRLIGQIFASFGEDTSGDRLIGCLGTVCSASIPNQKIGQVDAIDPEGNLVTISATLPDWATVIPQRGMEVLVIDRQSQAYLVVASESSDRDRWLAAWPRK